MLSGKKSQLFGRRLCDTGFLPSLYHVQPANVWFDGETVTQSRSSAKPKPQTTSSSGIQSDGPSELSPEKPDEPKSEPFVSDGTGTVVAILDTGVQHDHQAFTENKFVEYKNFLKGADYWDCRDDNGHGTECAGLACGLKFTGKYEDKKRVQKEVAFRDISAFPSESRLMVITEEVVIKDVTFKSPAPGARLMVCKIANDDKHSVQATIDAATEALEYIVKFNKKDENKDKKVDVISLSFGFDNFNKKLALAVQNAISADIIVVCCASNDGVDTSNPITYPGRLGNVLCIGACDSLGQPARLSSEGREVDFMALGTKVLAPTIGECDTVQVLDGTSYSTPSVAGLICQLLQDLQRLSKIKNRPKLHIDMHNVWCMRELLKSMSVMQGHHDKAKGYGKLIPEKKYFNKGDEEKVRICDEILGKKKTSC